ncbi:M60 family metallopeptidase, partial [Curtobacterium sp. APC 4022]|uniref:M60 family metallopeptidase n=1 Tax=Curtobacterium sp. APC 4022 TaxID=3035201 RepID=UPI0025B3DF1B
PEHTWPTVTSGHTDVPVIPLGSAAAAQERDGTQAARSDLRQAGRWIRAHQTFVVEVPEGVTDAEVAIGQHGTYFGVNGCRDLGVATQALHPGQNLITAPHDGLVGIIDRSTSDRGTIVVRGGAPVPTFVAGVTARADFDTQLQNWDRSPFFSLIGERVQADVLRADATSPRSDQNEELIAGDDLDVRMARWDATVRANERFWGVEDTGHRVHIETPSYGVAGANAPTNVHPGWVAFPTDSASPHNLFTSDGSAAGEQALRNAVGRVFQQDALRWRNDRGQTDGTISQDLASVVLEEQVHQRNPLDSWRAKVEQFRQQPVAERDFWSNQMNGMTRHLVFDQLRRAYGEDFIATVSARVRSDVAAGSDREARRAFVLQATHVAGHDLTPFFEQWGVQVEDDLRPHLAEYPALEAPIWDDFDALD